MRQNELALKSSFVATITMATGTFFSRIVGLVREQVLASIFGASWMSDAFWVAYRIPNLLRDLFAEGSFSSAFVPTFTEVIQKDPKAARGLLWSVFCILLLLTGLISVLMILGAPQLVALFSPSFTQDQAKFDLTVLLVRIMAPFLTLISLAALFMGVLNTLKVFFVPSFAPVFYNVVMILFMLVLPPYLIERGLSPALSLGFGVLVGGFFQAFFQFPFLVKKGFAPGGPLRLWSFEVRKILKRMLMSSFGLAATQINLLVSTILATSSGVGAVSWLSYSFRLFQLPVGILGVSVAGSNLVHFGHAWKQNDRPLALNYLQASYDLTFLFLLPSMALLLSLSSPLVHLVYERGAFSAHDTAMTTLALNYYLLGLPFYGLYKVFSPVFFALDRPKVTVMVSAIFVGFNILFCLIATPRLGFQALALGTSLSMLGNAVTLAILLRAHLDLGNSFFLNKRILIVLLGSGVCFLTTSFLSRVLVSMESSISFKILQVSGAILGGGGVYLVTLFLFGQLTPLVNFLSQRKKSG